MSAKPESFVIDTPDGTQLHVNRWLPDGKPKAVVQIAHGMAEHSGRYQRFADRLTGTGYAVYASDHRGHGKTAQSQADKGYFTDRDGFATVVADLGLVGERARADHPGLPFILFGHSMGSFLSRGYAIANGDKLDALVLSGTAASPGLLGKVGRFIASVQARLRGRRHPSKLMNALSFGQYNKAFKPNRTEFDWLTRDPAEVDAYIADPDAGGIFTAGFYADLLGGLAAVNDDAQVAKIPKSLPIYVVSGSLDPVGGNSKGVRQVADQLARAGVRDVSLKLWPGGRHEMLNETNRDEVMDDLVRWMDEHLPAESGADRDEPPARG
ncbi:alpha/beta hydrolase [Nakamurella aerolata]|uniref:Alpha/beta hydrolase n=1 Tax=Nakamurella aerolata TaxID=1656892 RepID=A0A849A6I8_9ACTN|nr:alpha/beta hydrolase [Nakamurella aerolata]NNG35053.1 alpha/beta hydrolase [Nakamurella aerolata]